MNSDKAMIIIINLKLMGSSRYCRVEAVIRRTAGMA
jgi:hypothetical protein